MPNKALDRQLRYFLRIAECGSLTSAADELDQSQAGLSKQLTSLENSIGQQLFIRTGRGLELTQAGNLLYKKLRSAFWEIDQAINEVRQLGVDRGTVNLAAVHTLSYYFMGDVVANFISSYPQVNLSILGRSSPEVVELVHSGKADLGLVYDSAVDVGNLNSCKLFDDEMALVVRSSSPRSGPQDISDESLRLVGFPPHYALRKMIHSARLSPHVIAETETIGSLLRLVSSGVGDCILPSRIPDSLLAGYDLRKLPIAEPVLSRSIVVIRHAEKPLAPLMKELLACINRVAAQL